MKSLAFLVLMAAACGGSSSTTIDAKTIDAKVSSVKILASCSGVTPKATIAVVTGGANFMFSPSTATINVNDVVQFTGGSFHPIKSGTGGTPDGNFQLDSGAGCAQFTAAGTFPFFCAVHLFTGTITVQ